MMNYTRLEFFWWFTLKIWSYRRTTECRGKNNAQYTTSSPPTLLLNLQDSF